MGIVGQALAVTVTDTVALHDGLARSGTLTFTLFQADCTTVALGPSAAQTLSSNGTTPASASASYSTSWTPPATGDHYWVASYSRDRNHHNNHQSHPDDQELATVAGAAPGGHAGEAADGHCGPGARSDRDGHRRSARRSCALRNADLHPVPGRLHHGRARSEPGASAELERDHPGVGFDKLFEIVDA